MIRKVQHLEILSSVWFKVDEEWKEARISTRRGGVYQIEVKGETEPRLVTRQQIKRVV